MNNRILFKSTFLWIVVLSAILPAKNNESKITKAKIVSTSDIPTDRTILNINNWSYWLYSNGRSGIDPKGDAGGIYPRGTANVIYQDGVVWGARLNDQIYVGGQQYSPKTRALSKKIYRIRPDWNTLGRGYLLRDAMELYQLPQNTVTNAMLDSIISRYKSDWKEWPVDQGAPYVDRDQNGIYNPVVDDDGLPDMVSGDYPGVMGADQVIWFKTQDMFYPDIEQQVTVWAYHKPDTPLDQIIFKRFQIKNTSSEKILKEMYLSQWTDTDLGDYTDDLAGCDSTLGYEFSYNNGPDEAFDTLGVITPAVAYALLQGPIVPSVADTAIVDGRKVINYRNLPMTSYAYYAAGSTEYFDPSWATYEGNLQWYNLLRGYMPTSNLDHPSPFYHRLGDGIGPLTKFPLNGDPVTGIGDVDGQGANFLASFRHMVMVSGPFDLQPGDSQEMVVALVGGQGSDYLNSVKVMQENIQYVYGIYDKLSSLKLRQSGIDGISLGQNYPNPFNIKTHIHYQIPVISTVELSLYNLLGQKVRTLVKKRQAAGTYILPFDGSALASGVYFYRLSVGNTFAKTRKLVLIK